MCALPRLFGQTLVVLSLATPALADLTAAEVWSRWQTMGYITGKRLSAAEEIAGKGTLSLRDVAVVVDMAEARLKGTIPRIDLAEQPDGSVAITLSPQYAMRLLRDDGTLEADLAVDAPDLTMLATGDAGRQDYAITGPRITLTLGALTIDDAPVDATFAIDLTALSGTSGLTDASFTSSIGVATLGVKASGRDLGKPGMALNLDALYRDLAITLVGDAEERTAKLSHLGSTVAISVQEPDYVPFDLTLLSTRGHQSSALRDGMLDQTGRETGLSLTVTGGLLPLAELPIQIGSLDWATRLPVAASETARDLALRLDVEGITPAPAFWGQVDPTGALPQDPASLHVDLTGQGRVRSSRQTGVLHSLDLNALRLTMAGVELTGQGSFRFDPAQPGPAPAPDGTLDLTLKGTGALLDKLVQLGLIPGDQAMGAQLILGLFTIPVGDDQLGTTLTFTPDGKITANGQRVQ